MTEPATPSSAAASYECPRCGSTTYPITVRGICQLCTADEENRESAAAERCPGCGSESLFSDNYGCGSPVRGWEQSYKCLHWQVEKLQQQLAAVTAERDRWARAAADSDHEVRGLQAELKEALMEIAALKAELETPQAR